MPWGIWLGLGAMGAGCLAIASVDAHRLLNAPDSAAGPWRRMRFVAALAMIATLGWVVLEALAPSEPARRTATLTRLVSFPWLGGLSALGIVVSTVAIWSRRAGDGLVHEVDAFGLVGPAKRQPLSAAELARLDLTGKESRPDRETLTSP